MKWIILFIFTFALTACIYTDEPIIETRDVVVSQQANTLELGNNWESIDVSQPSITTHYHD